MIWQLVIACTTVGCVCVCVCVRDCMEVPLSLTHVFDD